LTIGRRARYSNTVAKSDDIQTRPSYDAIQDYKAPNDVNLVLESPKGDDI